MATAKTCESAALNILKGDQAEVVAPVNGPQRLVSHMWLGDLAPLYVTSGGTIILSGQITYMDGVKSGGVVHAGEDT